MFGRENFAAVTICWSICWIPVNARASLPCVAMFSHVLIVVAMRKHWQDPLLLLGVREKLIQLTGFGHVLLTFFFWSSWVLRVYKYGPAIEFRASAIEFRQ